MSESILAFLLVASSICTLLTALIGVFVSIRNSRQINITAQKIDVNTTETKATHDLVNHQMEEFKTLIEKAAHAAGAKEEVDKQEAKR